MAEIPSNTTASNASAAAADESWTYLSPNGPLSIQVHQNEACTKGVLVVFSMDPVRKTQWHPSMHLFLELFVDSSERHPHFLTLESRTCLVHHRAISSPLTFRSSKISRHRGRLQYCICALVAYIYYFCWNPGNALRWRGERVPPPSYSQIGGSTRLQDGANPE